MFEKCFGRAIIREESIAVDVVKVTAGRVRSSTSQWGQISNVKAEKVVQPLLNGVAVSVSD